MTAVAPVVHTADLTLTVEAEPVRVAVAGVLDLTTAAVLRDAVAALLASLADDVVLDLRRLEFLDAAGMSSLVQLRQLLELSGHRLELANIPSRHARLLGIAGLGALLDAHRAR